MRSAWFGDYQAVVARFFTSIRQAWPVPAQSAALFFPGDDQSGNIFSGFVYIDVISACLAFAVITAITCWRIEPPGETFSRKYGRQPPRGSWIAAIFLLLITSALSLHFYAAIFRNGSFFAEALHHCAQYSGTMRHGHCVAYADNSFTQTIGQLGWLLSLATIAMTLLCALTLTAWKAAWQKARFRQKPLA